MVLVIQGYYLWETMMLMIMTELHKKLISDVEFCCSLKENKT